MRYLRLSFIVVFALALVATLAPVSAQEPDLKSCQSIAESLTGKHITIAGGQAGVLGPFEEAVYTIRITNVAGTHTVSLIGNQAGTLVLAGPAPAPVTFTYVMPPLNSQPEFVGIYVNSVVGYISGSIHVSLSCSGFEGAVVGGCDTQINLPADAVVGQFVADAPVYWEPSRIASAVISIEAGKTFWVAGQDATGMFRKVLLSCEWVWVEAGKVGPNPDAVWNNKPLPTTVVE